MPEFPKRARVHFEADKEQHHDDTEFGKMLKPRHIRADQAQQWADQNPGNEVAQNRSQAEPRCNRNCNHPCEKKRKGDKHEFCRHGAPNSKDYNINPTDFGLLCQ